MKKTEIVVGNVAITTQSPKGHIVKYEGGYFKSNGKSIEIYTAYDSLKETHPINSVNIWATE